MWDPSLDSTVAGYVVYAGTQSGVYTAAYDVGIATSFTFGNAMAGQLYYFTVAAYAPGALLGPASPEVSGSIPAALALIPPGDLTSYAGEPVVLQLAVTNPSGRPVSYSASGLPPGLSLDASSGLITGSPASVGTYAVTAAVADGMSLDTKTFTWTTLAPLQDVTPPLVTISTPTATKHVTAGSHVVLGGTARDNVQVVAVDWVNHRGGSGQATGTDAWIAGVLLRPGRNDIAVSAIDGSGNRSAVVISVYRQAGAE